MSLATVEMSGPLAAVLQQQAASSPSDFQAYLFGRRILSNTSMATDFEEKKKVEPRDVLPAPWKKQAAPLKVDLAPTHPAKLTKSAGRSRAKLTADSIDTPFRKAHK